MPRSSRGYTNPFLRRPHDLAQGVSGTGKSAVLKPAVRIRRAGGTSGPGLAIARFIAQHRGVIHGSALSEKLAALREGMKGALLLVDEASQISTVQMR